MLRFYRALVFICICSWQPSGLSAQLTQTLALQNGFPNPKGVCYWQSSFLIFNQFFFAPTKNFSFGVGFLPTFEQENYYLISLKFAAEIPDRKISAAFGFNHLGLTYKSQRKTYVDNLWAITYGVVTFGTRWKNLSLIAGGNYPWVEIIRFDQHELFNFSPDFYKNPRLSPCFGITMHWQGKGRTAFVMENFFFQPDKELDFLFTMFGLRRYWTGFALDLSVGSLMEFHKYRNRIPELYLYPAVWVNFFVSLRKNKAYPWHQKQL